MKTKFLFYIYIHLIWIYSSFCYADAPAKVDVKTALTTSSEEVVATPTAEKVELSVDQLEKQQWQDLQDQLTKKITDLKEFKKVWEKNYSDRMGYYEKASNDISVFNQISKEQLSRQGPGAIFNSVNAIWRGLVEKSFTLYKGSREISEVPNLPFSPEESQKLKSLTPEEWSVYQHNYQSAVKFRDDLVQTIKKGLDEELYQHNRILIETASVRSRIIEYVGLTSVISLYVTPSDLVEDIFRELQIMPHRWTAVFLTRVFDVQQKYKMGAKGAWLLIKQVVSLGLVLLIPLGLFYLIKQTETMLERIRSFLLQRRKKLSPARNLAIWIPRIQAYVPWGIFFIGIYLIKYFLSNTFLQDLVIFIPFFSYYAIYRVFRLMMAQMFGVIAVETGIRIAAAQKEKVIHSAKVIGMYFFIASILLHTIESAVGKGLIFGPVFIFSRALVLILFMWAGGQWAEEVASAFTNKFKSKIAVMFASWGHHRIGKYFITIPGMIFILFEILFESILNWLGEYSFIRKISARMMRRKIEEATEKEGKVPSREIPNDYRIGMQLVGKEEGPFFVIPESGIYKKVHLEIKEWLTGVSEEHSLAIYGNKGAGNTSMLTRMEVDLKQMEIDVIRVKIPPKLYTKTSVAQFFETILTCNLSQSFGEVIERDKVRKKTVLLLDECQNLFLAQLGGFEGLTFFIELINLRTTNLFFLASFNKQSWNYLNAVFAGNRYFRAAYEVPPFSEDDIAEIIRKRHKETSYTLSYDKIINATGSKYGEGPGHIEERFFRLLWEQSNGNPRLAIELWLSALRPQWGKVLRVELPEGPKKEPYVSLADDAQFVYASILKHENLTGAEAMRVTNLPEGLVRYALKMGLEIGFIFRDNAGRYRVTPKWQDILLKFLSSKNFIYGN